MSRITTRLTIIVLIALGPALLEAQEASSISLNELHGMVLDQQQTIESQAEQIANQQTLIEDQVKALKELSTKLDQISQSQAAATGADIAPPSEDEIALRERLAALEKSATAEPEMPANVLTAGEFPGSIRIPGTNMAGKVGGNVRLGVVSSFDPIGSDDRFIVGSIPVPDEAGTEAPTTAQSGTTISAKRSRMNLDMRMDSSVGQFRAFIEGDFTTPVGSSDVYRLRHAFGQYNRFILGQTWSTFMDLQAQPDEIDFEGLNSQILERHPILRWTKGLGNKRIFAIAIEDPSPQITGGSGKGNVADLVSTIRFERERWHVQLGGVARDLSGEQTVMSDDPEEPAMSRSDSTFGWGLSASGSRKLRSWSRRDRLTWQFSLGEGIGRYVNDLSSIGGQDAVFDLDGSLQALPVVGGYVSYQHYWKKDPMALFGSKMRLFRDIRSTLTYGFVRIDNFDFQPDDAYKSTQRASINLIWSPIAPIDLGVEYLWGRRENKNRNRASASQLQIVATFKF